MLICGQEFNFSALNAKDIERMDTAQQHMTVASQRQSAKRPAMPMPCGGSAAL